MEDAAQYALFDEICRKHASFVLNEFASNLKNISGTCMDIGCGPGDITKEILLPILDSNVTVIGTDISEEAVEYANKMYADKERLKFEVLDIQTKKLSEKYVSKFDHVFSFNALQWCHDIPQTFKNIYSMLRPGKAMLILSIGTHAVFESMRIITQNAQYAPYIKDKKYIGAYHNSIQSHELKEILENIGFQVHNCNFQETSNYLNTKRLTSMLISQPHIFGFLKTMSHNLREEFKNEFMCKFNEIKFKQYKKQIDYNQHHDNKQMDIPVSYTVLIIYAQKSIS